MSGSLKDQLVALGLAKEPRKPSARGRKPAGKRTGKGRGAPAAGDISLDEAYRRRQQAERQQREDSRRKKLALERRRRELNQAISALVDGQALNDPEAEHKRHFMYKERIRSVPVTAGQLRALNAGELGLVFLKGRYLVLPLEVVAKVRELSEEHVPDLDGGGDDDEEFPVPDDVVW